MSADILARNNVNVSGKGERPMLFAHGFGCDQNMWRYVAPAFADDHRLVLFDYVGSGRSDLGAYDPQRYADLEGYADDLLDVCRGPRPSRRRLRRPLRQRDGRPARRDPGARAVRPAWC